MSIPKSVTKVSKNGVTFISNVDQVNYSMNELTKAALRDVARYVGKEARIKVPVRTGTLKKNIGTWVRYDSTTKQLKLQLGTYTAAKARDKNITPAYHAHLVQFGHTTKSGKLVKGTDFLSAPVLENIATIVEIESQYLSALTSEAEALAIIGDGIEEGEVEI